MSNKEIKVRYFTEEEKESFIKLGERLKTCGVKITSTFVPDFSMSLDRDGNLIIDWGEVSELVDNAVKEGEEP